MMYDELIEDLRKHHCDAKEDDRQEICEECAYDVIIADKNALSGITSVCVCGLMHRAADAIEEFEAQLMYSNDVAKAIAEKVPKWIPATERLPEEKLNPNTLDFVCVLCATIWGDVRPFKFGSLFVWDEPHFWDGGESMDKYVTHWMPLPEPPKEE